MVTSDLSTFGTEQLNTAKNLLEELKHSNIPKEANLQLKWDKQTNVIYPKLCKKTLTSLSKR